MPICGAPTKGGTPCQRRVAPCPSHRRRPRNARPRGKIWPYIWKSAAAVATILTIATPFVNTDPYKISLGPHKVTVPGDLTVTVDAENYAVPSQPRVKRNTTVTAEQRPVAPTATATTQSLPVALEETHFTTDSVTGVLGHQPGVLSPQSDPTLTAQTIFAQPTTNLPSLAEVSQWKPVLPDSVTGGIIKMPIENVVLSKTETQIEFEKMWESLHPSASLALSDNSKVLGGVTTLASLQSQLQLPASASTEQPAQSAFSVLGQQPTWWSAPVSVPTESTLKQISATPAFQIPNWVTDGNNHLPVETLQGPKITIQ